MSESLYFGLKQLPPGEVGPDDKGVIDRYAGRIAEPIPAPIEVGISSSIKISDEYHAEIVPGPRDDRQPNSNHTEPNQSTPVPEGPVNPIPPSRWAAFFSSPQGYVITATVAVLLAGATMYGKLDSKISAARIEGKADSQSLEQRIDKRFDKVDAHFDKVDARFDKIDARFDSLLNKMDADSRETRSLIRDSARASGNSPAS